eukprot:5080344-Pleurochrysis_carterae.AAC.1
MHKYFNCRMATEAEADAREHGSVGDSFRAFVRVCAYEAMHNTWDADHVNEHASTRGRVAAEQASP